MFLNILSKHLPNTIGYVRSSCGDGILELLSLVESARYHNSNFNKLVLGQGKAPDDFISGVDFKGDELDRHWRFMACVFEFEGFLTDSKRFLDQSWRCLQNIYLEAGIEEQEGFSKFKNMDTLGRIINCKKPVIIKMLRKYNDFSILENAWKSWGEETVKLRNFFEHDSPLGGRTTGYSIITSGEERLNLLIPDEVNEISGKSKREFQFKKNRLAHEFSNATLVQLDLTYSKFITEGELLNRYRDQTS